MAVKVSTNSSKGNIIAACVFLIIAVICFLSSITGAKERNAIKNGVIVEADIVAVGSSNGASDDDRTTWYTVYKYVDENGVLYTGYCHDNLNSERQARAFIGTTVQIYIDGDGYSIPVGSKPSDIMPLIFGSIFSVLAIVIIVLYVMQRMKSKNSSPKADDTSLLIKPKKAIEEKDEYQGRFDD